MQIVNFSIKATSLAVVLGVTKKKWGADTSPTETLADDEILSELSFTATLHGRWPDRFLQRQSKKKMIIRNRTTKISALPLCGLRES